MKHQLNYFIFKVMLVSLMIISCQKTKSTNESMLDLKDSSQVETDYLEPYRPQFHFSPPSNWMNDPNGLVYNKGLYHLFYQYYPEDIVWGPMHWGHAVSKDLISWTHKSIALFPDEHGYIFSGSAVIDHDNLSGFGTKTNPAIVAIFTYHRMEGEKAGRDDFQTQGIAYSLDDGETWTKYESNPVITNPGIRDFRDPKVFYYDETEQWILILVAGDHAKFYSSSDLKSWKHLSDFGKDQGAHGGVWECPDLFKIKIEGADKDKWVLLISINPGAPNGGSGTQYFIGEFDGKNFTADDNQLRWLDWGADNYAGITFNNTPNNERIFIGWMSNWNYAQKTPTKKWRSAMTLPRNLVLTQHQDSYYLQSKLVPEFDAYTMPVKSFDKIKLEKIFSLEHQNFNQSEIFFKANLSDNLLIDFTNSKGEQLTFQMDPNKQVFVLNRMKSGLVNFEARYAEAVHIMPFIKMDKEIDIRIILDWSSIEIFIDDGRYVFTEQIFPTEPFTSLEISSSYKSTIRNFKLNNIKSIW